MYFSRIASLACSWENSSLYILHGYKQDNDNSAIKSCGLLVVSRIAYVHVVSYMIYKCNNL